MPENSRISHLSVGVSNPKRAAEALAELTHGELRPFTPVPGAFACLWGGWEGQFVEIYPKNVQVIPTDEGADFTEDKEASKFGSVHINLRVDLTGDQVKTLAKKYGYTYHFRPYGGGPLHEVWLENELMVELVTKDLWSKNK